MIAGVSRWARRGLILLIRLYRLALAPLLGDICRFEPSCSRYAEQALRALPLWRALPLILWRLLRCQPLCKGGFDPVPARAGDEKHCC